MKSLFHCLVILSTVATISCSEGSAKKPRPSEKKAALVHSIDSLEGIFYANDGRLTDELASALLKDYMEFSDAYITDEHTPQYLYKAAGIARGVQLPGKAIRIYQRILDEYPDFDKRPEASFLIAFIFDTDMQSIDEAKTQYKAVIDTYPNSEWAAQATARLETIDMSDEELIEMFQKRNAESI